MKQKGVIIVLHNGQEIQFDNCAYKWNVNDVEIIYGLKEELVANFNKKFIAGVYAFGVED